MNQLKPALEELVLVIIGYLTHTHTISPFCAGLSALLGMMVIDNLYFYLIISGNKWIQKLTLQKCASLMQKLRDKFQRHQFRTSLLTAFIPKLRFLGLIVARLVKMVCYLIFLINMFGSMSSIIIYLRVIVIFHNSLNLRISEISSVLQMVFGIIIIISFIFFAGRLPGSGLSSLLEDSLLKWFTSPGLRPYVLSSRENPVLPVRLNLLTGYFKNLFLS